MSALRSNSIESETRTSFALSTTSSKAATDPARVTPLLNGTYMWPTWTPCLTRPSDPALWRGWDWFIGVIHFEVHAGVHGLPEGVRIIGIVWL
ncbi:MAG: hypothetical protein EXR44_04800 [Dehalococcoidia bacterium]|nr:hypothetical protein [Dehalococcoidia bacterium]